MATTVTPAAPGAHVANGLVGPGPAIGRVGPGVLPAAAASAVLPLLIGPALDGAVIGVFSRAVIVGVDTDHGPRIVSLLARDAAGAPNGVRLAGPIPAGLPVRTGARVLVGDGGIGIGAVRVRVVRYWSSAVQPICPDRVGVFALDLASAAAERGVPLAAVRSLAGGLTSTEAMPAGLDAAVAALVGLGRGLTPGGDDVLAGLLTGLRAGGSADLATSVSDRLLSRLAERTTLLSADLLRLAAAGHAGTEVLAVLRAVHRPRSNGGSAVAAPAGRLMASIEALLSVGHTSGADLATGLAMGLKFAMDREDAMTATRLVAP